MFPVIFDVAGNRAVERLLEQDPDSQKTIAMIEMILLEAMQEMLTE